MDAGDDREVSKPSPRGSPPGQAAVPISSLDEAWLHALDRCLIGTPLCETILPLRLRWRLGFSVLRDRSSSRSALRKTAAGIISMSTDRTKAITASSAIFSPVEQCLSPGSTREKLLMKRVCLTPKTEKIEGPTALQPPAPPADSASTVLALIERVALDPGADAEKLERMTAMYEGLKAKEAELAYNAAKSRILKKLAGIKIVKNRCVLPALDRAKPQTDAYEAFIYAPLEEIDKHLRPLLAEEDMDLSYSDEPGEGGSILIRGRLKHPPGGHYEDSFMPAPPDTTGGKSKVQAVGSTNSYLRRYVACNIFNIVVVRDDDD
jgi:ERF superfamily